MLNDEVVDNYDCTTANRAWSKFNESKMDKFGDFHGQLQQSSPYMRSSHINTYILWLIWLHNAWILGENSMHLALYICVSDHSHGFPLEHIGEPWDALQCPSPPFRCLPSLVFPLEVFRLPGKWNRTSKHQDVTWTIRFSQANVKSRGDSKRICWGSLKLMKKNTIALRFLIFLWHATHPQGLGIKLPQSFLSMVYRIWIPIQWSNGPLQLSLSAGTNLSAEFQKKSGPTKTSGNSL